MQNKSFCPKKCEMLFFESLGNKKIGVQNFVGTTRNFCTQYFEFEAGVNLIKRFWCESAHSFLKAISFNKAEK
jgi:hypothetical protein